PRPPPPPRDSTPPPAGREAAVSWAMPILMPRRLGDQHGGGAQPPVVAGLARQVGEQVPQVSVGVTDPPGLEVYPSSACITARVTSSASVNWGCRPIFGRHGARSGYCFSRSSVLT